MREVFLLSGLGADKRVFDFLDLSDYKLNHIGWIEPLKDESIESYAKRLSQQITAHRPVLIGVSFGGMMAIEIGKIITTEKIILISSAKTKFDIPWAYRLAGKLRMNKAVPSSLLKKWYGITPWFFGVDKKDEKKLLRSIIQQTDAKFLSWAINSILTWENKEELKNIVHVHGTHDKLLPFRKADFRIAKGGHLMIVNKPDEINRIIREVIKREH